MPVPTDELTRLSTGAPTGYNNDPFNASTNPYGFADGGYITNFFAALNDLTVVTLWMTEEIAPLVDITAELEALGAIVADLQVLAGIATDIQTLAAIDMQLTTLAAITADITTVAANVADVSAVADDIAKVAAVEAKLVDIEAVADGMANIVAVLAMASNINTVVVRATDIATLADIEDGTEATNAIQTVAAISTAVSNVSTNSANVAAVAGDLADINTLAGISSSVSALGPIASDIAAVADIGSDVEAAADNIAAIVAAPAAAEAARKSVRHIIFDSGTADAHPGSGHFRLSFDINAATVGQTGFMYHDVTDADLGTIAEWIESWDDVINATGRGNISLVGEADPSISMMLRVTGAVTSGTSYRKIPVTLLQKSVVGGSFADEMEFSETFQANGNDAGGGAGTGDVVSTGSITSGNLVRYADGSGDVIEDSGNAIADFFDKTADTLDDVPDGSTYVRATPAQLTKLSGIETAADVTDAGNVGASIAGSSNKSTPVSADRFALLDSAGSNALVYATFAQVLAGFQTSFDSRYSQLAHTHAWASLTSKPTTVSGAGLTDAVTLAGSETLTNKTLTTPILTLEQGASVAPTVEGRIAWDIDDNKLKVGDGAGTKTFSDDGANAAAYQAKSVERTVNLILNGDGRVSQGSYTTVGDDTYWCDQHYVLTQTASITPTVISDVADGLPSMMRLTQSQATAQRMGNAQIIESVDCKRYRGKPMTLGGKLRCSSSQAIRFAILEWTGTADVVTSDVVNSWTNGTFTAGQFFSGTDLTVRAVGAITPSAATITDFSLVATLGSALNDLILFYWTEGTAAQNVTLDMAWELQPGDTSADERLLVARPFELEQYLCQRFYEVGGFFHVAYVNSTNFGSTVKMVRKRSAPTILQSNVGVFGPVSSTPQNAATGAPEESFLSYRSTSGAGLGQFTETWSANSRL